MLVIEKRRLPEAVIGFLLEKKWSNREEIGFFLEKKVPPAYGKCGFDIILLPIFESLFCRKLGFCDFSFFFFDTVFGEKDDF